MAVRISPQTQGAIHLGSSLYFCNRLRGSKGHQSADACPQLEPRPEPLRCWEFLLRTAVNAASLSVAHSVEKHPVVPATEFFLSDVIEKPSVSQSQDRHHVQMGAATV